MRYRSITALTILAFATTLGACGRGEHGGVAFQTGQIKPDTLRAGDIRIFNDDTTIDLVLVGREITTGLSDKVVGKVRHDMDTSMARDTGSGFGASIGRFVKSTVASAIGTRVRFNLADLQDVRYVNGQLVFDWKQGSQHDLFKDSKVNGRDTNRSFRADDAQRFIDAVHARQKELAAR